MILLENTTPTGLWIRLGMDFFNWRERNIDQDIAGRRFVSLTNVLTITDWPKEWSGGAMFELVGYSSGGTKLNKLWKTYVDDERLTSWIGKINEVEKSKKYFSIGMQFNMKLEGKGGCLSSLHYVSCKKGNILYIHGKVAEIPRKFVGDLILVSKLLEKLNKWPIKVVFMYSTVYFSIVNLRAYVTVFGKKILETVDLPILEPRNYQAGTIERLNKIRKDILKKYPKGCLTQIDYVTGEWK